jgi:hypothetical protein
VIFWQIAVLHLDHDLEVAALAIGEDDAAVAGMSRLPTIAPSSTTQRPPEVFLLFALCPVFALTCQPSINAEIHRTFGDCDAERRRCFIGTILVG